MLASNYPTLNEFVARAKSGFERELTRRIALMRCVEPLREAIQYAMFPGGKRIRPLLAAVLINDLRGDGIAMMPALLALELVHTASLIHDDLPEMDNDDFRRGRASCHKQFGAATALLAGDFMVSEANVWLLESHCSAEEKLYLVSLLNSAYCDVCSGQQLDMIPANLRVGDLELVHELKTGSLFRAACGFAGIGLHLSAELLDKLEELGLFIGAGFQIVDDYVDCYGTTEERGRPESSDRQNEKTTFFSGKDKSNFQIGKDRLAAVRAMIGSLTDEISRDVQNEKGVPVNFSGTLELVDRTFSVLSGAV